MKKDPLVGKRVHAKCVDVSFEGKGVVFALDNAIFVSSMLPEDEGEIEISYRRNGAYFGKVVSLSAISPYRIEPLCPLGSVCGGCVYQSLSYTKEKELKERLVANQFHRNGIEATISPLLGMEDPYRYRNKVAVPFGTNEKGELVYGFYKEKSHDIVPSLGCVINDSTSEQILRKLLSVFRRFGLSSYDEKTGKGLLRHALIRVSRSFQNAIAVLICSNDSLKDNQAFINAVKEEIPEITSLFLNLNDRQTNVILGDRFLKLYGPSYLEERLGGLFFLISPQSFFQVNSEMAEILYKTAIDLADIQKDDVVFDAYSGTGAIGLFAAKTGAKKVIAVEVVKEAVEDSLLNAKNNSLSNYSAVVGDATAYIEKMAKCSQSVDVLFMDPPRKGSTDRFLEAALMLSPKKIVYVSCSPITLARDLMKLIGRYEIKTVQPVDMFPRTPHVETILLLCRKDVKNA